MTELNISLDRLEDTISVFGSFDENIRLIEHELGVTVVSRDSVLKVSGEDAEAVGSAEYRQGVAETIYFLVVARTVATHQREVERLEALGCCGNLAERYARIG